MKIAFIVGEFPVLSETFIINQAAGLLERGHEVDIYAESLGDTGKLHQDVIDYGLLDRIHLLPKIPENLALRAVLGFGRLVSTALRNPLRALEAVNFFKHGEQAISLWLLYTLILNFRDNYDVVHCQFGTLGFRGMAFRAINARRAKLVAIFRGDDISRFVQERGDDIYKSLFEQGDFFLTNCDFFRQRVIQLGCPPSKIKIHGSGLDCSRFPFQLRQFPEDGVVRVATTGRLVEKKGIEYSIRAVAQALKAYPNLQYFVLGEGPLRPEFEQLIEDLDAGHAIHLLGRKSQSELIDLLETMHLFIAPSVTAADGNQDAPVNVLKEAMAMGLPVISTLHGGIPELVQDGVSGFLVPERDADAIAQKLLYLIEHPDLWPNMGRSGRAYVESHYDLEHLNDELVAVYRSLLTSRPDLSPSKAAPITN